MENEECHHDVCQGERGEFLCLFGSIFMSAGEAFLLITTTLLANSSILCLYDVINYYRYDGRHERGANLQTVSQV
jgi:hypothetical protein